MKKIVLVGQPNTGKSCFFNHLTGLRAIVSNYPGTTVEIKKAKTYFENELIEVVDLPGIYSLSDSTEDERVAKEFLVNEKIDAIIQIVDCTALARNFYLTLKLIELNLPIVLALNFHEEAREKGILVDEKKIKEILGVDAVFINALLGKGIHKCVKIALRARRPNREIKYCKEIENAISEIMKIINFENKRYAAIRILEGDEKYLKFVENKEKLERILKFFEGKNVAMQISIDRHGNASIIAQKCSITKKGKHKLTLGEKFDEVLSHHQGIAALVIIGVFLSFFFSLIFIGGILEELIISLFQIILPYFSFNPFVKYLIIGIEAGFAIVIPYIFLFYLFLAILEDTGFLARITFLSDRIMHQLGLHGKSLIPLLLGFGCNVPAVLSTRILTTEREKIITNVLISMIPCSARTAIILGAAGYYLGWQYALLIYLIILVLIFLIGKILSISLPGKMTGLIMEIPEYRRPLIKNLFAKTWIRMRDFISIAFPLLIIGSGILGFLNSINALQILISPLNFLIEGWLLLPSIAGIPLIFGILRKEMALEMLAVLGGTSNLLSFMTPSQIFTFSLVSAIYFPCLGTLVVLAKELGIKRAILIAALTILVSFLIGGIAARI